MENSEVKKVIVVGGGSAGFLVAITLKNQIPSLEVTVIHSSKIPIVGVGEGTTLSMPSFLHGFLGIDVARFHREVHPTYKLGIQFLWGHRGRFHYTFSRQLDNRHPKLERANGFYCDEDFEFADLNSSLMANGKAFSSAPDGKPKIEHTVAYHLENQPFVDFLEKTARQIGVVIKDGTIKQVQTNGEGVAGLHLQSGEEYKADLYVDCSGFRSELIGKALEEPFIDFRSSLFCDRAVAGGWNRTDEVLMPYTTAETMNAGWSWKIEHDHLINRGYVYSSDFISDDEAEREFSEQNPKATDFRIIKFKTGAYKRSWVKNVVALGNAAGFVEPLEATSLAFVTANAVRLVRALAGNRRKITVKSRDIYNQVSSTSWQNVRRFLAMHYQLNSRDTSPFWKACREETDLAGGEAIIEFYREYGPGGPVSGDPDTPSKHRRESAAVIGGHDPFGWEGYLTMLVGQKVSYRNAGMVTDNERLIWNQYSNQLSKVAEGGLTLKDSLDIMRSDEWSWPAGLYPKTSLSGPDIKPIDPA